MIDLMDDEDTDVRDAAYRYAGGLNDEKIIEPIVSMLNNPDDEQFHANGINSLVKLWYDYPLHKNTSESAYRATMDYLRTTPVTDKIPTWTAVTSFKNKADNFDEWRARATYYNPDEIEQIMTDLIENPNANWLGRTGAVEVIAAHCSKEAFDALSPVVDSLTDNNAKFIQDEYKNQAENLNK